MFGIGSGELIVILIIAVLVVGPEKMVQYSAQLGRLIARLRAETSDVTREFRDAFDLELDGTAGKNGGPSRPDFKAPGSNPAAGARAASSPGTSNAAAPAEAGSATTVSEGSSDDHTILPEAEPAVAEADAPEPESAPPATPPPPAWVGPLAAQNEPQETDGDEFVPSAEDLAAEPVDISVGEMVYEDEEAPAVDLDGPTMVSTGDDEPASVSEEEDA